jgi:hypothetical protein
MCVGNASELTTCSPAVAVPDRVLVLVDSAIAGALAPELTQFMSDLGPKAKRIDVNPATETTVAMKQRIREQHTQEKLAGVIAIGALPNAKWYNDCDHGGSVATFNSDLYFTDIDHTWSDGNNDGYFESTGRQRTQGYTTSPYTSCVSPDKNSGYWFPTNDPLKPIFWLSRIVFKGPDNSASSMINTYKQYFARNHAFRTGLLTTAKRGLNLVIKDWSKSNSLVNNLYASSDVTSYFDPTSTRDNWVKEITTGNYEAAMVWVHSNASGHQFPDAWLHASEIYGLPLKPLFYNLWACSAGDHDAGYNTVAQAYLGAGNTLAVMASSKTGATQGYNTFQRIKLSQSMGTAFNSDLNISFSYFASWLGGMILFGDGSLYFR